MRRPVLLPLGAVLVTLLLTSDHALACTTGPLEFHLTFDPKVSEKPFSGRVYVMLGSDPKREPRLGPNWFKPAPFFAADVKDWKPDTPLVLTADKLIGYPHALKDLPVADYQIQAVMDFDLGSRSFGDGPGNAHSDVANLKLDPERSATVKLRIDRVIKPKEFPGNERVKLVDIPSKLLTKFHGREVRLRAAVILPQGYDKDTTKRYPIMYEVPGFGGNHHMASRLLKRTEVDGVDFLHVVLDPDCRLGHHVFADSANNGPCGRALIEELIPNIEKEYRAFGVAQTRFVTGHSSGGWSSLWLQVRYPDTFNGCWSTAPDPVDFRDFQRVNIYKPGVNVYTAEDGKDRPLARVGGKVILTFKGFCGMEAVMGRGGQLASFEAVFSPRGQDGKPLPLWDRKTGAIDSQVAKAWEAYDIRLMLERNWKDLGPRLRGKMHVYMGGQDTFYLDGATALLKESLQKLGSDAVIEIVPNRTHGDLIDTKLRERMNRETVARFRQYQAARPKDDSGVREGAAEKDARAEAPGYKEKAR